MVQCPVYVEASIVVSRGHSRWCSVLCMLKLALSSVGGIADGAVSCVC